MSLWRQLSHGVRTLMNRSAADQDIADEVQDYYERSVASASGRGSLAGSGCPCGSHGAR
mgnify:CR=1 FL=1